jgi:hypothetical protein
MFYSGRERLTGTFTVKEGAQGQLSLFYESVPGTLVTLELAEEQRIETVQELAKLLNLGIAAIRIEQPPLTPTAGTAR